MSHICWFTRFLDFSINGCQGCNGQFANGLLTGTGIGLGSSGVSKSKEMAPVTCHCECSGQTRSSPEPTGSYCGWFHNQVPRFWSPFLPNLETSYLCRTLSIVNGGVMHRPVLLTRMTARWVATVVAYGVLTIGLKSTASSLQWMGWLGFKLLSGGPNCAAARMYSHILKTVVELPRLVTATQP